MCGIAGTVHVQESVLKDLVQALYHRGPDDQTIYQSPPVALIQTRLAIQDVQLGKQPFHFEHYSIVFNGEIYNHQVLRQQLKEFSFHTNSDTETLLYLFVKFGYKMFDMVDGMFAFCIYDQQSQKLILARDRAGKKPLYYYHDNQRFIFASELNAIKKIQKLNIMPAAIETYLRTGMIWKPYTPYYNVRKLEAGSILELDINNLTIKNDTYFNVLKSYRECTTQLSFPETLNALENILTESVSNRLLASDVEVGVFLSGGIDSNLVAAIAAKIQPNIKTFTVKFQGLYDESALAKLTAEKYKTDHIELPIANTLQDDIEKILVAYGEPFMDSSAIPCYYVSQAASQYVKVVLSGDGADELFAGYRRYVPTAYSMTSFFKFLPFQSLLPKPHNKKSLYNYLYRLMAMSKKSGLDYYLSASTDVFEDVIDIPNNDILSNLNEFIDHSFSQPISGLKKMLYTDFSVILFCDLLVKMDIASMANSLEVRSPFLSKSMLEFVPSLPDRYKISKFQTKFVLRKLAQKYLPEQLINQPKRGFEVPLKKWVDQDLHDRIHDSLQGGCYAENFFDRKFIHGLLHKKINVSEEKRAKMLWSLYCLEVWYKHETKNLSHC